MKVRLNNSVIIRTSDRETLLCDLRRSAYSLLRDAEVFLKEFHAEWRSVEEIEDAIARKFGCGADVVKSDLEVLLNELVAQGFVEIADCLTENRCGSTVGTPTCEKGKEDEECGDELIDDFFKRHSIPVELHIDLTDACTERCVHCYVPKGQNDYLSVELVEKALTEFRAANGLTVHLTGGEAMLHPDFERICRKCAELNLNFIIFSNMTLCDEKRIAFLKEVHPQFINVSLYSMKSEEHDAITQLNGSWRRTMDAILKCCDAGVVCRIATPLLRENQDALPALRKFADDHRMHLVPCADIIAQSDHGCGNLAHACSATELRHVLMRDHRLFHKFYEGTMPSRDAKVCDIGTSRLYLNAKGNYYPCDSMHEYVLGNARKNTIAEIWKGEKLDYLRGLKNQDFGVCATCEKRPWCKVCPAANFNATGDLFKHNRRTCTLAAVVKEVYGNQ